ncbi:MAG: hypothetical protein FJY37_05470 [Betaproteobacteria bacterium]|nr:hypothetical protein [Betaproteobacteria bacterium]
MAKPANDDDRSAPTASVTPLPRPEGPVLAAAVPEDAPAQGITQWLAAIGEAKYAKLFISQEISLDMLPDLTEDDIMELALPVGPRRRILKALGKLKETPPAIAPAPDRDSGAAPWVAEQSERRQITVLFCDLVEVEDSCSMIDVEDRRALMDRYYVDCEQVVERYGGHIAQKLGDGVMVYFGWPTAHEEGAARSVMCALDLLSALRAMEMERPLHARVGIATGTVVVSQTDSNMDPATGLAPNLAARLQGLAQPDQIIISNATRGLLGDAFDLIALGEFTLKGITQPERAWRVLAAQDQVGRFEAAPGRGKLTPLVARQEEIRTLMHHWEMAREGHGRVELIVGEAGIGKSRLALAFCQHIAGDGHIMLRYQCSPYHTNSALHPIAEQIAAVSGFERVDTDDQKLDKLEATLAGNEEQIRQTAALIATVLGLPPGRYPDAYWDPVALRERTLELLAHQVELLARKAPVLMVFEDLHWIDPTSEAALSELIPRLHGLRVMLLMTFRPEYTVRWLQHPHVHLLHLARMARPEVARLIQCVSGKPLPENLAARIASQTDGVPLFIEELTKSVLESGVLIDAGDRYASRDTDIHLPIPVTLRDSLLARLDRMAPVKRIVQTGACIGRTFSFELLSHIVPLPPAMLEHALTQLTDAGLLYRRGVRPGSTYTFKHALVQEAAYESLLTVNRQQLHVRIAQVLVEAFPELVRQEPELLAHHYTMAGLVEHAVSRWRDAGRLAQERAAPQEAVAHFQQALRLLAQLPPCAERDELELSIREPLNAVWTALRGWATPEVADNARTILALSGERGGDSIRKLGTGVWALWVNTVTQGRIADSMEWCHRMLTNGVRTSDLDLQVLGHGASMISQFCLGDLLKARAHGERVRLLYDPAHAARWMAFTAHDMHTLADVWAGQWTWMLGYPDQAVRICDQRDEYARELGDAFNLGFALSLGAYVFDYRCEPEALRARTAEAGALDSGRGARFMKQIMLLQVDGLASLRAGHYKQAIETLTQALHEDIANQAFDLALVVAFGWPTKAILEQVVTLQLAE